MKKINPILTPVLIMVLFSAAVSFSEQDIVCIDPGHGGPGASQYGSDGLIQGTWRPVYQLSEQWLNL